MKYQLIIGLEVHCELKTRTKMFCSCKNKPQEAQPNFNVCPICMGHPGTLPFINKKAVEFVVKTGIAIGSKIQEETFFERKNYFYPDLPKGYQISQCQLPLCQGGILEVNGREIKINRIHLEEDTGKLLHPKGADYSLVDFNRAGVPLMELVTEPVIKSAIEARCFAQELQLILKYLSVSDADMDKGQMRVEANISLSSQKGKMGTKTEIKNLNSFRAVERAIEYEVKRQTKILDSKEKVIQETRGWDEAKEKTVSQRTKEEAHDYRYFPEPDLPPLKTSNLVLSPGDKSQISNFIPELPRQKRERFKEQYNIDDQAVEVLIKNRDFAGYFEKAVSELKNWVKIKKISEDGEFSLGLIKLLTNYLTSDLAGLMKAESIEVEELKIAPENFAELIATIYNKEISSRVGKDVLFEMFKTGADPSHIIKGKNLAQVNDTEEIKNIAKKIIEANQKPVEDYKKGKENALQFLVGKMMKETSGRTNPEEAKKIFKEALD